MSASVLQVLIHVISLLTTGRAVCRDGCCVDSVAISLEMINSHTSAPALTVPGTVDNIPTAIVDQWTPTCFRCVASPHNNCRWIEWMILMKRRLEDDILHNVTHEVELCNVNGENSYFSTGYYTCAIRGEHLKNSSYTHAVMQDKCGKPPILPDAIVISYIEDAALGDLVTYRCFHNASETEVVRCSKDGKYHIWDDIDHVCSEPKTCQDFDDVMCSGIKKYDIRCDSGMQSYVCQETCGECTSLGQPEVKWAHYLPNTLRCWTENTAVRGAMTADLEESSPIFPTYVPTVDVHWWTNTTGMSTSLALENPPVGATVQCRYWIDWVVSEWSDPFLVTRRGRQRERLRERQPRDAVYRDADETPSEIDDSDAVYRDADETPSEIDDSVLFIPDDDP